MKYLASGARWMKNKDDYDGGIVKKLPSGLAYSAVLTISEVIICSNFVVKTATSRETAEVGKSKTLLRGRAPLDGGCIDT